MGLVRTVGPAAEPITRVEAKLFCKVDDTTDDAIFDELIAAARERCEQVAGLALITQTWQLTAPEFPLGVIDQAWDEYFWSGWGRGEIRLPQPPLQSVTSITYLDTSGNQQTLSPSLYLVDTTRWPGRIAPAYGTAWPGIRWQPNSIVVTYVAGYGAAGSNVPSEIKQRLKNYIAYCYLHRLDRDEAFLDQLFARFSAGEIS